MNGFEFEDRISPLDHCVIPRMRAWKCVLYSCRSTNKCMEKENRCDRPWQKRSFHRVLDERQTWLSLSHSVLDSLLIHHFHLQWREKPARWHWNLRLAKLGNRLAEKVNRWWWWWWWNDRQRTTSLPVGKRDKSKHVRATTVDAHLATTAIRDYFAMILSLNITMPIGSQWIRQFKVTNDKFVVVLTHTHTCWRLACQRTSLELPAVLTRDTMIGSNRSRRAGKHFSAETNNCSVQSMMQADVVVVVLFY